MAMQTMTMFQTLNLDECKKRRIILEGCNISIGACKIVQISKLIITIIRGEILRFRNNRRKRKG